MTRQELPVLDHISFQVSDFAKARAFYEKALAPLGYAVLMEYPIAEKGAIAVAGFGRAPKADFRIAQGAKVTPGVHVAFAAADRATVDAFYKAAMAAGGKDNGGPGLRPQYHPNYYGAFVFDPDGHNVEAVCRTPA
jgi:catechol 2,3-dioxygenase-like lactoylglutathione lyase family enzyme